MLPHRRLAEVARIIRFDAEERYASHSHKRIEINYVRKGECYVWLQDKKYHFREGELMMIASEEVHSFEAGRGGVTLLQLEFLPEVMTMFGTTDEQQPASFRNNTVRLMRIAHNRQLVSIIQRIIHELSQKNPLYQEMVTMYYAELLVLLNRCQEEKNLSAELNPILGKALVYIGNHWQQEVKINELADYLGISERYLRKLFMQDLCTSPLEYINRLKITRSIELMQETEMTLKEISFHCGFSSPQHFSRVFKAQEGVLPSQYVYKFKTQYL